MPQVRIKLRDLDTDERTIHTVEVERVPDNPMRQQQDLAALVAKLEPKARQRSFEEGVASFVGRQHLIVARFLDSPTSQEDRRNSSASGDDQDQLFAA